MSHRLHLTGVRGTSWARLLIFVSYCFWLFVIPSAIQQILGPYYVPGPVLGSRAGVSASVRGRLDWLILRWGLPRVCGMFTGTAGPSPLNASSILPSKLSQPKMFHGG